MGAGLLAVFLAAFLPSFSLALSWSSSIQLNSNATDFASYSQIVVDRDNNYLVFWRDINTGAIQYKRFNWLSQSFEPATITVTTSSAIPDGQLDSVFDCVRDSNGLMKVFWLEGTTTESFLKQRISTDGVNWQPDEVLRSYSGDLAHLAAAVDKANNVYVAFTEDGDLKLAVYNGSWSTTDVPDTAGTTLTPNCVRSVDVSADETGTAYIVWRYYHYSPPNNYNARIRSIKFSISTGFSTATDVENIYISLPADEEFVAPSLVRDRRKVYVAWETNRKVYFSQSFNDGATWTPPAAFSSAMSAFCKPRLTVDRTGRLHFIWVEMPATSASLCYRNLWNGKWSNKETLVSENGVYYSSTAIAADRNANPLVSWSKAQVGGGSLMFKRGISDSFEIYKTSFETTPTVTQPGSGWQVLGVTTPTTWGEATYRYKTGQVSLWCAGTNNPAFGEHRYQPNMRAKARYLIDMSGFVDGQATFNYLIPSADGQLPPGSGVLDLMSFATYRSGRIATSYLNYPLTSSWLTQSVPLNDIAGYSNSWLEWTWSSNGDQTTPADLNEGAYLDDLEIYGYFIPRPSPFDALQGSSIYLNWGGISLSGIRYEVWRADTLNGPYTKIKETTATSYLDKAVTYGEDYFYKVRASDGVGVSPFSEVRSVVVYDNQPPAVIINSPFNKQEVTESILITTATVSDLGRGYSIIGGGGIGIDQQTVTTLAVPLDGAFDSSIEVLKAQISLKDLSEGTHTLYWQAWDNRGNNSLWQSVEFVKRDLTPPETSITVNPSAPNGLNNWYITTPTVTLTTDETATTYYRWNAGSWQTYSEPISPPSEGTQTLDYYSIDTAGNTETVKNVVLKIDTSSPRVVIGSPKTGANWVSGQSYEVTWTAVDSPADPSTVNLYYSLNGGVTYTTITAGETNDGSYIWLTPPGVNTNQAVIKITAADEAGNQGFQIKQFSLYTPVSDRLLISSVCYDPSTTEPAGEWVEIYNPQDTTVNISYWYLIDGEGTLTVPPGVILKPKSSFVVANSGVNFYNQFNFLPDFEINDTTVIVPNLLKSGSFVLSNTGDEVGLFNNARLLIDAVVWESTSSIFPTIVKHPGVPEGKALTRVPIDKDTDDCSFDFIETTPLPTSGGVVVETEPPVTQLQLEPVSPDGSNGWYITYPTVSFTVNESATTFYQFTGSSLTTYTAPFRLSVEGSIALRYYSIDLLDNKETTQVTYLKIDASPPETNFTLPFSWQNTTVTAQIEASDSVSGINQVCYRLNGGEWQTGNLVIVGEEGTTSVECYAVNNAGLTSTPEVRIVRIDKTLPVISVAGVTNGRYYNTTITPEVTFSDPLSGLDETTYTLTKDGNPISWSSGDPISDEGNYTLTAYARDLAQNETTKEVTFTIDRTSPIEPSSFESTPAVGSFSNDNLVEISWSEATDTLSGVDGYSVSFSKDTTEEPGTVRNLEATQKTIVTTFPSDGTWWFNLKAVDKAGNWTPTIHYGPFLIDTEAPQIIITGIRDGARYNTTLTPQITINEPNLETLELLLDGNLYTTSTPISTDGEHRLIVRAVDKAGNISQEEVVFYLDLTSPRVVSYLPNQGVVTSTSPEIKVKFSEPVTGVSAANFKLFDGNTIVPSTVVQLSLSEYRLIPKSELRKGGSYTVLLYPGIKDLAGNSLKAFTFTFHLEKEASSEAKGDVNGDGKMDTIILYDLGNKTSALYAFISNSTSFNQKLFWKSSTGAFDPTRSKLSAGDVNRDGKADAIILYDNGGGTSTLYAFLSTGSSFTQKRFWKSNVGKFSWARSKLSAGDVNRDGKADAIILYDCGKKTSALYAFISNGSSFTSKRFWVSSAGGFDFTCGQIAP